MLKIKKECFIKKGEGLNTRNPSVIIFSLKNGAWILIFKRRLQVKHIQHPDSSMLVDEQLFWSWHTINIQLTSHYFFQKKNVKWQMHIKQNVTIKLFQPSTNLPPSSHRIPGYASGLEGIRVKAITEIKMILINHLMLTYLLIWVTSVSIIVVAKQSCIASPKCWWPEVRHDWISLTTANCPTREKLCQKPVKWLLHLKQIAIIYDSKICLIQLYGDILLLEAKAANHENIQLLPAFSSFSSIPSPHSVIWVTPSCMLPKASNRSVWYSCGERNCLIRPRPH